jgi:pre-60S factor REI1
LCRKSYLSENAYNNHIQSKKHLEWEQKADEEEEAQAETEANQVEQEEDETMTNADTQKAILDSLSTKKTLDSQLDCLFCHQHNSSLDSNLSHMSKSHGFFLPDIEYLKDRQGLVNYLFEKINTEKLCLYCNGRGKEWQTSKAARAHMTDRGHCKMAYDESEDPEQLLKFYDFGTGRDDMDIDETAKEEEERDELVLDNGLKLGHRKFLKYYKRNTARKTLAPAEEAAEEAVKDQEPETLRRKERRHLTITDGKEQEIKKTADGIKEASISKDFSRQLAFKQNNNQTLRARVQNPK